MAIGQMSAAPKKAHFALLRDVGSRKNPLSSSVGGPSFALIARNNAQFHILQFRPVGVALGA